MWISELFYSIQGEGMLAGVPSVFIRTSGCNLRCAWCDTPYTSWEAAGEHRSIEDVMAWVREHSCGYTVVTGGEPMIAPDIVALTERLREARQHITIETAGTVFAPVQCDLMSISPKLAHSTPPEGEWRERHEALRYQPEVLRRLIAAYPYQLKFVVASEGDVEEVRGIMEDVRAVRDRVLLMPEGTTVEAMNERGVWVAEVCKREGWRFSPRLHVYLYGNQRGT